MFPVWYRILDSELLEVSEKQWCFVGHTGPYAILVLAVQRDFEIDTANCDTKVPLDTRDPRTH